MVGMLRWGAAHRLSAMRERMNGSMRNLAQSSQGFVITYRYRDGSTVQPMIREGCPFSSAAPPSPD